jgi:hypothetical protein
VRSVALAFTVVGLLAAQPASAQRAGDQPRTATPTKGLLFGSKMTVENEPCCAPQPGARAGDAKEAPVLASIRDRALRDGPILRLRLQNGRSLKITDCDDQTACEADRFRRHWLAAWWPAQGYYVVNVGLYEEGLAYLISEKDGRTTRIAAVPVLSPSGRRAVALVSNLMSGVDLEVIDLSTSPPRVSTVSEMPACAGAGPDSLLRPKPVWVDDTHVRFEGRSPQPGDHPNTKQLLRLVDGKPQWQC